MNLDPALRQLGEELKTLDAHRSPELTVEHLLRAPATPIVVAERAPTRAISQVRWMSVAAAVVAAVLLWRVSSSGSDPTVLDAPPTVSSSVDRPSPTNATPRPSTPVTTLAAPLASWTFDSGAREQVSSVGDATLTADDAHAVPGRSASALEYTGVHPSAAQMSGPLVDTTRSFTVSTLVRASTLRDCLFQAFASQDGTTVSGFELGTTPGCSPDAMMFTFAMPDADTDAAIARRVTSATTITAGRWYHVVGVYDADAAQIRLYVDGVREAVGAAPETPWSATGRFAVGRARFSAQERDYFFGAIDTTTVWQSALTDAQVAAL